MPLSCSDNRYKLITCVLAVVTLLPLLVVLDEMWDGDQVAASYILQDFSFIALVKTEGWHINYWLRIFFNELYLLTGVPHKVFTNIMSVAAILGIARESYKYIRYRFAMSDRAAYWGAWVILAFPAWHTQISSINAFYVLYLWLFMVSVNLMRKSKALALLFFVPSLQYFSIFSFAVGFACVEFFMTATRENFRAKALRTVSFSAVLVIVFVLLNRLINMHGESGTYNTFNLYQLDAVVWFLAFALVPLGIWFYVYKKNESIDSGQLLRVLLSFLCLFLFAALPYWAVGRPLRFFAFGSFTARHTILTCVPLAVLASIVYEYCAASFNRRKVVAGMAFLLVALVVLLYQGYDHKAAALLYKDMLTASFAEQNPPESGYVGIFPEGYNPPRHVHNYSINMCLFKAYGKAAWMANGSWRRHLVPTEEALRKLYPPDNLVRSRFLAFDVSGDAYTPYVFKLENFHQEGRLWYWYNYLAKDYSYFNPGLRKKS